MVDFAPHEADLPALATRRGGFWIVGDLVEWHETHLRRGPMWVE